MSNKIITCEMGFSIHQVCPLALENICQLGDELNLTLPCKLHVSVNQQLIRRICSVQKVDNVCRKQLSMLKYTKAC